MKDHRFHHWVEQHREEIVETTRELLRINSVGGTASGPDAPFGDGCRRALDFVLDLGKQHGFRTKDLNGYAGHVEYGESDDYIAVLSHLDVVPEGNGWNYPPFGAEIHEGRIYARGAIDDKGPAMAAYFALRAIRDLGLPMNKRVRLIFGCSEENTVWECMNYYFANEPKPIGGFTPDADFPLIYAEKGILSFRFSFDRDPVGESADRFDGCRGRIIAFEGGERENMVPDHAFAVLTPPRELNTAEWQEHLKELAQQKSIPAEIKLHPSGLRIDVKGVSAHGSTPELGINAATRLAQLLAAAGFHSIGWIRFLAEADTQGQYLGIACSDAVTGALSANIGVVKVDSSTGSFLLNVRYPVDQTAAKLVEKALPYVNDFGLVIHETHDLPPLYVPEDSVIVRTLSSVYEQETGEPAKLLTIGGGTYARAIPNAVAFGALFPGQEDVAHQRDEYWAVEDLLRVTAIYANAIWKLSNADWL